MLTVLISLSLLVGVPVSPQQDSITVSREEFQDLQNQVETLEDRLIRQESKGEYFTQVLQGQRWTFGTVVTLFAALLGLAGFGAFRQYLKQVEETEQSMREYVEDRTTGLESGLSELSDQQQLVLERIRVLERRQETSGQDPLESMKMGVYPTTFVEMGRDLLDELPTDDEGNVEQRINPSLDLMRMGLDKIDEEYGRLPKPLEREGLPLLKKLRELLEGWEEEREMISQMIHTIEEARTESSPTTQ